ncbi:MAG: PD-(D/E)XK nuclease family protein [Cycloclasticus sp.]|jgi:hypothetical protein
MTEFFEVYKAISEKQVTMSLAVEEPTPNFTLDLYQSFFAKFEPLYLSERRRGAEINVWGESGLKQDEVRNTAVLSWWLDCNGSHGLGDLLLKALLGALPPVDTMPPVSTINNDYRTKAESLPMGERENRIDIELSGSDFLIFIEVKINAGEGYQQLSRYQGLIKKKAESYGMCHGGIIYLTRYDDAKKNEHGCMSLSWTQLARSFRAVKLPGEAGFSQMLLMQFCEHIENF